MSNTLQIDNLVKRYDAGPVLNGLSLTAEPGDTIAIVGPSGSGKSTLLHLIGALDTPTAGTVKLGELQVTSLRNRELALYRARRVGFIFQDHHLLPQLTALENVLLPTLAAGNLNAGQAESLLERVGIAHRAKAYPAQMSGGERQRAAVARALINGADVLLCDEPTGNLDRDAGMRVVDLLLELARDHQVMVLMVTHNLEMARRFNRCLELREGRLHKFAGVSR